MFNRTFMPLLLALAGAMLTACGNGDPGTADTPTVAGQSPGDGAAMTGEGPVIDPERYHGLYGVEDELRGQFFVIAPSAPDTPEGFIEIGAVWGDVAPWLFRPESPTRFVQHYVPDYSPEAIVLEFELDADGNATALTFLTVFDEFGRRPRIGDVPDHWR